MNAIKRGLVSVFVCAVVLMPLLVIAMQFGQVFKDGDSRKVVAAEPLNLRPADRSQAPLKPFDQPIITVTFDDGWESIYTTGLPLLQKHGIPTTQYVLTGVFEDKNYMTIDQIKSLQKAGHEIACHGIDHADLTSLTASRLDQELRECKQLYEDELGTRVEHFASPYGRSNPETIAAIKQSYRSHRNTVGDITTNGASDQDINTRANFNRYNINTITIRRDTTDAQLQQAIDYTIRTNGWLVLNYHDVGDGDSTYGVSYATLDRQLAAINRANARVATIGQVMAAIDTANARKQ